MAADALRKIPSVDRVAHAAVAAAPDTPERLMMKAARAEVDDVRKRVRQGHPVPDITAMARAAALRADLLLRPGPRPVINATGVIIHTNLGRAPLSDRALDAIAAAASGYADLEFDLATGARGARTDHIDDVVREATGAESALVFNNNAAALFLALEAHAAGREVLVSRGEAVEIGGGFRIPEILRAGGAELRDVGTTNRTRIDDYASAISDRTAAILRVHRSNFEQIGFTESPPLAGLAALAREHGLILIDDLGSGSLLDTATYGLAHEPQVQESLAAGAHLVTFSGDKLIGGPQAGVIAGERGHVVPIAARPLARAMRADKLTIAGLRATFGHYLRGEAAEAIPVWRMIAAEPAELRERARRIGRGISKVEAVESVAAVGGGSLPGQTLPSCALRTCAAAGSAEAVAARLRAAEQPVVGRIEGDAVWLDLRTVLPRDEPALRAALRAL